MHYQLIIDDNYCFVNEQPIEDYYANDTVPYWIIMMYLSTCAVGIGSLAYYHYKENNEQNYFTNTVDDCLEYVYDNISRRIPTVSLRQLLLKEIKDFDKSTLNSAEDIEITEEDVNYLKSENSNNLLNIGKIDKMLSNLINSAKKVIGQQSQKDDEVTTEEETEPENDVTETLEYDIIE